MKDRREETAEEARLWRAAIILSTVAFFAAVAARIVTTPPGVYQRIVTDCIMAGGEWEQLFHGRTKDRDMHGCVRDGNLLELIPNPNRE